MPSCSGWADPVSVRKCSGPHLAEFPGYPELHVLDSTDPAQVKAFEGKVDLKNTLFIVSSKSGTTLEPNIFKQYFFDRVKQLVGKGGRPPLHRHHRPRLEHATGRGSDGFRHVFFGWPSIGGRYSALSDFGLVPAAIMGVDVAKVPGSDRGNGLGLRAVGSGRREPGRDAGHDPRDRRDVGPRQGHNRRFARDLRCRRLAGTIAGGVDGQARQGTGPDGSRGARPARGLWRRPHVRLLAIAIGARCDTGQIG